MGECILVQKYSVVSDTQFAVIAVTYPEGSVCTCTDGNIIFSSPDTSGSWLCNIPSTGTWTMNCNNRSKSVNITEEGQFVSIVLSELKVFDNGDITAVSGGWDHSESYQSGYGSAVQYDSSLTVEDTLTYSAGRGWNSGGTDARPRYGTVYTKKAIDMTHFNQLTVNSVNEGATVRVSGSQMTDIKASVKLVAGTNTLDISSVSGFCYISFYNNASGDTSYTVKISKITLE